jgi:LuxR family maltose regulon positive regulatory protein
MPSSGSRLFRSPPTPPRLVSRQRLLDALDEGAAQPLALVSAGPGWGKTVTLTEWAATRQTPPVWISLSETDNDAGRFWPLLCAALRRHTGAHRPRGAKSATIDDAATAESLLRARPQDEPLVVVLDDAHILTDRTIQLQLDELLDRCSNLVRVIWASRSDPLLSLHRRRLAGTLCELRADDLAMTYNEARQLVDAHGVALPDEQLETLLARTEGWVAGLRLSAMTMEGRIRPAEVVTEVGFDRGSAGEYLVAEVLDRLPSRTRSVLVATSFLDEVDDELARAVTDVHDAPEILRELSGSNSFVMPTDPSCARFRYHPLLREVLAHMLSRDLPARRRVLMGRAAQWYARRGDAVQALRLAVDAEAGELVTDILVHGGYLHAVLEGVDLGFVLDEVDTPLEDDESAGPDAELIRAALLVATGRDEMPPVQDLLTARPQLDANRETVWAMAEFLNAVAARDAAAIDLRGADLAACAARSGDGDAAAVRTFVYAAGAAEHFWAGRFDRLGEAATGTIDDLGLALQATKTYGLLSVANAFLGRPQTSREYEQHAVRIVDRHRDVVAGAELLVAGAIRDLYRGRLGSALRKTADAEERLCDVRDDRLADLVTVVKALVLLSSGDLPEARETALRIDESVCPLVDELRLACLAEIESALGRAHLAVQLLTPAGGVADVGWHAVALARAHLALGDVRTAEDLLRTVRTGGTTATARPVMVSALVAAAEVALLGENEDRSVELLISALEVAGDDLVLPFLRMSPALTRLPRRHPSLAARLPEGPRDPIDASAVADHRRPIAEPLTDRERLVLQWMTTTKTLTEIAGELCVSVNTVKTHAAAIYRKLAVARRRDAVLRARQVELL